MAPQLLYKGGIVKSWGKKQAVAVDEALWATLPKLPEAPRARADIAWFVYGLERDASDNRYHLVPRGTFYTRFEDALLKITTTDAESVNDFVRLLEEKMNR